MKKKYYVNKHAQSNGDHEVHEQSCVYLPAEQNRLYLGEFYGCRDAVDEAKKTYKSADGCKTCSPGCHTR
ncbi:hypothetical protein [Mucilaginibacter ginsenosidivorans]|uniref:Uncharacterized protein n=1 Tax=Mucilaginibacter ginsenosidivorans TaxID=398053 RepID=A0A5B8UUA8_9SPHI|nr:hypothetical protein [Mucilaginibacter ginsenosidivorans]QEC62502.1 hypothetical protein FRZ54_07840 [Mucilaginibacter ginsenosidivorans]